MPATHIPKYPVVDPDPDFTTTFKNFSFGDYLNISLFTSAGILTGYFGATRHLRATTARFLGGIGLFAGGCYASQSSWNRLMGLERNDAEVARYGPMSAADLAAWHKRSDDENHFLIGRKQERE